MKERSTCCRVVNLTGIFYHPDVFRSVGISAPPKRFADLLSAYAKPKATGKIPIAMCGVGNYQSYLTAAVNDYVYRQDPALERAQDPEQGQLSRRRPGGDRSSRTSST